MAAKEIKVKRYSKRVEEKDEKLANSHRIAHYHKILEDIEDKLLELTKLHLIKKKFEVENSKDEDFADYFEQASQRISIEEQSLNLAKAVMGSSFSKEKLLNRRTGSMKSNEKS